MKIELGVPDLADVSAANVLADLYTCRVCVNDVAQIFTRGIIQAQTIFKDEKEFLIFNHLDFLDKNEALLAIETLRQIYFTCHLKNSDLR